MARYTGPRVKKMRAVGLQLPGLTRKGFERKPYPPGLLGAQGMRTKKSDFGKQLLEKQKLRINFGVSEKYLRRLYREANRSRENTGIKVLELLERRLDNIVFRAGLAPSIKAARQLVSHKHILVNGSRVNIPSYRISLGDTVEVREKSRKMPLIMGTVEAPTLTPAPWLNVDTDNLSAKVITLPTRDSFPFPIEISSVVEFYSK